MSWFLRSKSQDKSVSDLWEIKQKRLEQHNSEQRQQKEKLKGFYKDKVELPPNFAENLLDLELEIETPNLCLQTITKLLELYQIAVEYFSSIKSDKYFVFKNKSQSLLLKPQVQLVLAQKDQLQKISQISQSQINSEALANSDEKLDLIQSTQNRDKKNQNEQQNNDEEKLNEEIKDLINFQLSKQNQFSPNKVNGRTQSLKGPLELENLFQNLNCQNQEEQVQKFLHEQKSEIAKMCNLIQGDIKTQEQKLQQRIGKRLQLSKQINKSTSLQQISTIQVRFGQDNSKESTGILFNAQNLEQIAEEKQKEVPQIKQLTKKQMADQVSLQTYLFEKLRILMKQPLLKLNENRSKELTNINNDLVEQKQDFI